MTLVTLGAEHWPEPTEQPADRDTLGEYDVDPAILTRWRDARRAYLSARAKLVGAIERQGWRAPATSTSAYIDVVFTGVGGGPDEPPAQFVEVEDDQATASATANGCAATMGTGRFAAPRRGHTVTRQTTSTRPTPRPEGSTPHASGSSTSDDNTCAAVQAPPTLHTPATRWGKRR